MRKILTAATRAAAATPAFSVGVKVCTSKLLLRHLGAHPAQRGQARNVSSNFRAAQSLSSPACCRLVRAKACNRTAHLHAGTVVKQAWLQGTVMFLMITQLCHLLSLEHPHTSQKEKPRIRMSAAKLPD